MMLLNIELFCCTCQSSVLSSRVDKYKNVRYIIYTRVFQILFGRPCIYLQMCFIFDIIEVTMTNLIASYCFFYKCDITYSKEMSFE